MSKKNDWVLKLLAIALAVMLWFYADTEQNPIVGKHFDIPVQYINQAQNYIVENHVQTVRVTVRGKETDLSGLRGEDFIATVDLSDAVLGSSEYAVVVTAPNVRERFSYLPQKVNLTIDQQQTKTVPVRVRTTGNLPSGYTLVGAEAAPDIITIAGMSQVLEQVSEVQTQPIDISSFTQDTVQEVALQAVDGITFCDGQQLTVHIQLQEKQMNHNYEATIALRNVPDGVNISLEQEKATLLLQGSPNLVKDQQELDQIQLYVDCSDLNVGQYTLPLQIDYNGALQVIKVDPDMVLVTVEESTLEPMVPDTDVIQEPEEDTAVQSVMTTSLHRH